MKRVIEVFRTPRDEACRTDLTCHTAHLARPMRQLADRAVERVA